MSPDSSRSGFLHRQVAVRGGSIQVVEAGPAPAPAIVFLHGWPESSLAFAPVMALLAGDAHVVALDLPGIGGSVYPDAPGRKRDIAAIVREVVVAMGLTDVTLVGHDIGGQVAFAYLVAEWPELARVVLMDMAVPGIEPWDVVIGDPKIWHLAFHGVPELPESLVRGRVREYFDHFYEAVNVHPERIDAGTRERYVEAYSAPGALSVGFGWYRAFGQDAQVNAAVAAMSRPNATPLLYVRGDRTGGDMARHLNGLRAAGLQSVHGSVVPDCGHFAPEEQPEAVAALLLAFMRS